MNRKDMPSLEKICLAMYIICICELSILTIGEVLSKAEGFRERIQSQSLEEVVLMLFITDAFLGKNTFQMKAYMFLRAASLITYMCDLRFSKSAFFLVTFFTKSILLITTQIIVFRFIMKFSQLYNWYYFKKLGCNTFLRGKLKTN